MFTGIIQEKGRIVSVQPSAEIIVMRIAFPTGYLKGLQIGASVAVNGCCLTATEIQGDEASFDLVPETLQRTCLKDAKKGDLLNAERSLRFGEEVGGHILSGHVDVVATIINIERAEHSRALTFKIPSAWIKYIFEKGYVALNGASLTVTHVDRGTSQFKISLIPETLAKTTFGDAVVGQQVHVEIDRNTQVIVDTVERVLAERK